MRRSSLHEIGSKVVSSISNAYAIAATNVTNSPLKKVKAKTRSRRKKKRNYKDEYNNDDDSSVSLSIVSDSSGSFISEYEDSLSSSNSRSSPSSYSLHSDNDMPYSSSSFSSSSNSHRRSRSSRRRRQNKMSRNTRKSNKKKKSTRSKSSKRKSRKNNNRKSYNNNIYSHHHHTQSQQDIDQMISCLQEIIPFYSDSSNSNSSNEINQVIHDTIQKLPLYAFDKILDVYGNTLLLIIMQYPKATYDLLPLLLSKGVNANVRNYTGVCALHYVSYYDTNTEDTTAFNQTQQIQIAQILLKHSNTAEIMESQYGCTPLHWSASNGNLQMCQLLVEQGNASPKTQDNQGISPIQYAKQGNHLHCVKYLEGKGDGDGEIAGGVKKSDPNDKNKEVSDNNTQDELQEAVWIPHQDSSGMTYYVNIQTGESIWEHEYQNLHSNKDDSTSSIESCNANSTTKQEQKQKQQTHEENQIESTETHHHGRRPISISTTIDKPKSKEGIMKPILFSPEEEEDHGNIDDNDGSKVIQVKEEDDEVDSYTSTQSSSSTNSGIKKKKKGNKHLMSKDTFEGRLSSLQTQMTEQFKTLLIDNDKNNTTDNQEVPKKITADMSEKIIQLQTDIGSKDIEILSLKREILAMEKKLVEKETEASAFGRSIGNKRLTLTDVMCQTTIHQDDEKKEKLMSLQKTLDENVRDLQTITQQKEDLQKELDHLQKEISHQKQQYSNLRQQNTQLTKDLEQERSLIQQLHQNQSSDNDDKDLIIASLQSQLNQDANTAKTKMEDMSNQLSLTKEQLQQRLSEISLMKTRMEEKEVQSKEQLNELEQKHQEQISDLKNSHEEQTTKIHEDHTQKLNNEINTLTEIYNQEKQYLKEQSKKELSLLSVEKDNERKQIITQLNSQHQILINEQQTKIHEMTQIIQNAKTLITQNETLQKALTKETNQRKQLHNYIEDLKGKIRVYVRIRPLSSSERERKSICVLQKEDSHTCVLRDTNKAWEFDQCFFGEKDTQEKVFQDTKELITSCVDGFNVCIFAYGQTGSGKTHTMFGSPQEMGLAPRVANELFRVLEEREMSYDIHIESSMFELYNDNVRDLLATTTTKSRNNNTSAPKLKIKLAEHSTTGLVEVEHSLKQEVLTSNDLIKLFEKGSKTRTTSSTQMNSDSSRSHLITSIYITLKNKRTSRETKSKLTLVDLAGSERISKTGADGIQLKEAQSINKSLSALGDVISALTTNSISHVPYRNHPLTMLMSDSLGGNAKTLMFVCCSPSDYNEAESVNSLDFGKRCKNVTNNIVGLGPMKSPSSSSKKKRSTEGTQSSQVRALRKELAKVKHMKGATGKQQLQKKSDTTNRQLLQRPGSKKNLFSDR